MGGPSPPRVQSRSVIAGSERRRQGTTRRRNELCRPRRACSLRRRSPLDLSPGGVSLLDQIDDTSRSSCREAEGGAPPPHPAATESSLSIAGLRLLPTCCRLRESCRENEGGAPTEMDWQRGHHGDEREGDGRGREKDEGKVGGNVYFVKAWCPP